MGFTQTSSSGVFAGACSRRNGIGGRIGQSDAGSVGSGLSPTRLGAAGPNGAAVPDKLLAEDDINPHTNDTMIDVKLSNGAIEQHQRFSGTADKDGGVVHYHLTYFLKVRQ